MAATASFVGIDVSKSRLDVATRPEAACFNVANDEAGVRELTRPGFSGELRV